MNLIYRKSDRAILGLLADLPSWYSADDHGLADGRGLKLATGQATYQEDGSIVDQPLVPPTDARLAAVEAEIVAIKAKQAEQDQKLEAVKP